MTSKFSFGSQLKEYFAERTGGYFFQTSAGNPSDASNVLERKLKMLFERLEIPKIDIKLLAKFVGKDRTIRQATRSERGQPLLGLHSFRHTVATAMATRKVSPSKESTNSFRFRHPQAQDRAGWILNQA